MPSRGAFMDPNGVRWVRDLYVHICLCILRLFTPFPQDTNNADFEGVMSKKSRWMGGTRQLLAPF